MYHYSKINTLHINGSKLKHSIFQTILCNYELLTWDNIMAYWNLLRRNTTGNYLVKEVWKMLELIKPFIYNRISKAYKMLISILNIQGIYNISLFPSVYPSSPGNLINGTHLEKTGNHYASLLFIGLLLQEQRP